MRLGGLVSLSARLRFNDSGDFEFEVVGSGAVILVLESTGSLSDGFVVCATFFGLTKESKLPGFEALTFCVVVFFWTMT